MRRIITSEVARIRGNRTPRQGLLQKQASTFTQAYPVVNAAVLVARRLLNAAASSVLLCDESSQRLLFAFADGASGQQIRRLKMSKRSGIAGQVATGGEPLVIADVKKDKNFSDFVDTVTGFTTKSIICVPLVMKDRVLGVVEMVNKLDGGSFTQADLTPLQTMADLLAPVIENVRLSQAGLLTYNAAAGILLAAVEAADTAMGAHAKRVCQYVLTGANGLALTREKRYMMQCAAILHDIGKLGLPGESAAGTDEERTARRLHPITAFNMLKEIAAFRDAAVSVLYHHERFDGGGYPKRLKGNAIPLAARLIAVADAFDNMTAPPPGGAALSRKDALTELQRQAGTRFDPAAVKAFSSEYIQAMNQAVV